jgi:hypothetical protein
LQLANSEAAGYLTDGWELRRNLRIEVGFRQDWDRLVGDAVLSPRLSLAYSPGEGGTRLAGGYAVVYDASNLAMFARPLDQYSINTTFDSSGNPIGEPSVSVFRSDFTDRRAPRFENLSFGLEQRLAARTRISFNLLRKRGEQGFSYVHAGDGVFQLTNLRRDVYDSAAVTVHQSFGREYEWMVNYTRSRALSNAVIDISIDQPLQVLENFGRLAWDTPNRLVSWGYLPGWGRNWAVAYLLDVRSGFPFSVQRSTGELVGPVNSHRFPTNFGLNLHLERRFKLKRYRFAVRAGVNNVTNSKNATGVNNVEDSPNFMSFYGREGRHAVFRLRFLKKE